MNGYRYITAQLSHISVISPLLLNYVQPGLVIHTYLKHVKPFIHHLVYRNGYIHRTLHGHMGRMREGLTTTCGWPCTAWFTPR